MPEPSDRIVPTLVAVGLLVGLIGLVVPWWTVSGGSGGFRGEVGVRPFDTDAPASETGTVLTGLVVVAGLLVAGAGLTLSLRGVQRGEAPADAVPWLMLAGGLLLLVGPLVAVPSWPEGQMGFWSSGSGAFGSFRTAAAVGWYLTLGAGVVTVGGAIAGFQPSGRNA